MIHEIKISDYDKEFLEELLDLADMEYTIKPKSRDTVYSIQGKTSKLKKVLNILSNQSIRFESDLGDYWDFR